VSELILTGEH